MAILSPSLLAADFSKIGEQLKMLEKSECEYLHLDVMDGIFVPNISFGQPVIASLRKITSMIFDVHLMITEPHRYFEDFKKCGANIITFHYEAYNNVDSVRRSIEALKNLNVKASVSVKPNTDISVLFPILEYVDMVLIMSVEPGFGGQKFILSSLEKVKMLYEYKQKAKLDFLIEIDGGVSRDNIKQIKDAGVDVIVAGVSVFEDIENTVKFFKELQ